MTTPFYDVVVVGAGISGITAGYYLQKQTNFSFTILESRHELGGTWSSFSFPGIRTDTDMFSMSLPFHPWPHLNERGEGADLLAYLKDAAQTHGIDKHMQFNRKILRADWVTKDACWHLTVQDKSSDSTDNGKEYRIDARFLYCGGGYYSHEQGHVPKLPGTDTFRGDVIIPQFWPKNYNLENKRFAVIGSGATAATIIPGLVRESQGKVAHVAMIQRTPSYYIHQPRRSFLPFLLRHILPRNWAISILRQWNIFLHGLFWNLCKISPGSVRSVLRFAVRSALPKEFEMDPHFDPPYKPWDQRPCLLADGDLFDVIKKGKVSIATGHIDTINEKGIRLKDGQQIDTDVIVQATGLKMQFLGGIQATVDGEPLDASNRFAYRARMLDGVPNLAFVMGYVQHSWTPGAVLVAKRTVVLLEHMRKNNYKIATPHCEDPDSLPEEPFLQLESGYMNRGKSSFPRASSANGSWRGQRTLLTDTFNSRFQDIAADMRFA